MNLDLNRKKKIKELCDEALDLDARERAVFLDEACADDEGLRREVEELLAAHQNAGSFIENPALEIEAQALAGRRGIGTSPMNRPQALVRRNQETARRRRMMRFGAKR